MSIYSHRNAETGTHIKVSGSVSICQSYCLLMKHEHENSVLQRYDAGSMGKWNSTSGGKVMA